MITNHLQLETIACDFCADIIERAVKSLPGIRECKVNLCIKQVVVEYDAQSTNLTTIQHALTSAGYISQPADEQSVCLNTPSNPITNQ